MDWLRRLIPQEIKNSYHFFQAAIAALIYRYPSKRLKVIGVTGTDGKTTTVSLTYNILRSAGIKASMVSTVRAMVGEAAFDTGFHVTTPTPFEIQKFLRMMVQAGSEVAILEVTSHALDQNRVAFVDFYEAVITNVTHEHLDYHGSYESYVKAKSKILERVRYRLLNADDESFDKLKALGSGKLVSFGVKNDSDLVATNIKEKPGGVEFDLKFNTKEKGGQINISLPLIGFFNVYNTLAAVAVAKTFGIDNKVIARALKKFPGVVGRMEKIDEGQNFEVIVDFAHTPNALEQSLQTLRKRAKNRLICVFGSAGERDIAKRPLMGEVAGKICDYTVITGEDPRHEDVNKIIREIAQGAKKVGGVINETYWEIPDRAEAIRKAIQMVSPGDTVAILGKGHEKSMNIGGKEYPWSDQIAARSALGERLKK